MSSPARALSAGPSASTRTSSSKKRVLSDSEDTSPGETGRVIKRSKSVPGAGVEVSPAKHKDKDKKRRKRKRRKVPVVLATGLEENTADTQDPPASHSSGRSHTRPATSATVAPGSHATAMSEAPSLSIEHPNLVQTRPDTFFSQFDTKQDESLLVMTSDRDISEKSKGKQRATSGLENQLSAELVVRNEAIDKHASLLANLQQSLTCQICLDLMHKPYTLAPCGHTACYSCLVSWFKGPPSEGQHDALPSWIRKKTCPHCRAVVRERPAELWVIKDMVASLVKSGLAASSFPAPPASPEDGVPAGDPWAGMFRSASGAGIFPPPMAAPMHQQLMGLHDAEDGGIYRCVECHHEIWDGRCSHCHRPYPGHVAYADFTDDDDDDDGYDLDEADLAGFMFGGPIGGWHLGEGEDDDLSDNVDIVQWPANTRSRIIDDDDDDDDEDESGSGSEEYEGSFIDDDELDTWRQPSRSRRRPSVIDLNDTDVEEQPGPSGDAVANRTRSASRQDGGSGPNSPRLVATNRHLVILSSDDDEDSESRVSSLHEDERSSQGGDSEVSSQEDDDDDNGPPDLASARAAIERDIYGDDGSIPRWDPHAYMLSDSEDEDSANDHAY